MVKVTVNGVCRQYRSPVTYEQLAAEHQKEYDHKIVLAVANNKIKELYKNVAKDVTVTFQTTADRIGHDTYVRSACMLMLKAVSDVAGSPQEGKASVEFSIGRGYFCMPRGALAQKLVSGEGAGRIDPSFVQKVKERMQELVREDIPVMKRAYPTDEAIELFVAQGMDDKVRLFRYRRGSYINVYCLDGYYDYNYGYMVPSTGYLQYFDLVPYRNGMMLMLPDRQEPERVPALETREKLFQVLERSNDWGAEMGIETVGDLNDKICGGDLAELVLVQEALQERRIGEIASDIAHRGNVKFVMIAGPSSSGKTTFSHRLSIQLKTHGLTPHPIAVDDYFVNRKDTPLDEDGNYNFECLEAIDVEGFNRDMCDLLAGKRVEMPRFNFKTGLREYKGDFLKLGEDDILVIEGIHGLNDRLSHSLPLESKYKIYISALTSLNVDYHNRIATTDGRLIRRLVRDARTRGASATHTLRMWNSVRRGEEENIFPFQESADAMFNSALIYELSVLKQYAEPLLYSVERDTPEFFEAKRLLKFLEYFLGVSSENIPQNSIVREFVGGSCFRV
ncbi:MAG TPA: nucleoside kinase [Candidatus Eisenbergiella merdavium]|uniref:Nucleoside kinase n=1 Tax=Candidatus Eisenbergiella merdavium TaxID=2838551 RepID=A0A9D2SPM1_9FIRM|nr:nucleoside kinase [Candidatus Eisenbergiella merdavium]